MQWMSSLLKDGLEDWKRGRPLTAVSFMNFVASTLPDRSNLPFSSGYGSNSAYIKTLIKRKREKEQRRKKRE